MKTTVAVLTFITISAVSFAQENWNFEKVKAGSEFSLGIKKDGTLWSWGFNGNGQLGVNTGNNYEESPIEIGVDTNWKTIAAGGYHALAIKTDGTLWGWGYNEFGQVNNGDLSIVNPVQIGTDTDWAEVEASYVSSFAIKNDGTLWAWGYNGYGELGVNDCIQRSQPTQVGAAAWKTISAGGITTMGIQEDNTLWRWGTYYNYTNPAGHAAMIDSIPVQIETDTDWKSVSAGMEFVLALKEDGTLWAQGDNSNKQLGYDTVFLNDFFQILSNVFWEKIEAGSTFSFAIANNKQLYAWGNNLYGQLGLNTGNLVSTPRAVPDMTHLMQISAAKGVFNDNAVFGLHTFALKEDGAFCCAGANYVGQLGIGNASSNRTPQFICNYPVSLTDYSTPLEDITVFPNPAKSQFTVTNAQNATLSLYNVLGQKILSNYSSDNEFIVTLENIPQGFYLLKIEKENNTITKKIQVAY